MKKPLMVFIVILILTSTLFAYSPGTTGFQFLRSHVGARPAAMGGAFVAVPNDIHAMYYNPAGIAGIQQRTAGMTYADDLLDFTTGFVAYVHPNLWHGNVGVGVLYKSYGDFTKTDINGEEMGSFGANNIALYGTWARTIKENWFMGSSISVGATGKYIRATIDNYSADAVAMDAGIVLYIPDQSLTIAAGIYNVGQAMSAFVDTKDDLPMCYRAGASKKLAHLPLMVNINVYKYIDESLQTTLGGEFSLSERVLFRLGYDVIGRKMHVDSSEDTFAGACIGFGLLFNTFNLDYAYSSQGALGNLNRFTLSGHF